MVWKGCSYVGASLCRLYMPSVFHGRDGFDVDTSHVFPQGVFTAITLIEGVAGVEVLAQSGKWDFLSAQCLSPPCQGLNLIPSCESRSPEGWAWADSIPIKYVFSLLPILGTVAIKEENAESNRACVPAEIQCSAFLEVCSFPKMQPMVVSFPQLWLP